MTDTASAAPPPEYPKALSWNSRRKSVEPMRGKETKFLDALSELAANIDKSHSSCANQTVPWQATSTVTEVSNPILFGFLKATGLLSHDSSGFRSSEATRAYMKTGDSGYIIAQLHSTTQFIGELLAALSQPMSKAQALDYANEQFGYDWQTNIQVDRRLKWLLSAELIEKNDDGLWVILPRGVSLLEQLEVQEPTHSGTADSDSEELNSAVPLRFKPTGYVAELTREQLGASTDSSNHARFEHAVRRCFEYLGFECEQLGGPGQTDVLLTAHLGQDASYRVSVEVKTAADGNLKHSSVDFVTLNNHRIKHSSDYSLLVGPKPGGKRLIERALEFTIGVISADVLCALCEQHDRLPLGLHAYRSLFGTAGFVDTSEIDEAAAEQLRLGQILELTLRRVRSLSDKRGTVNASDIHASLVLAIDLGELEDSDVSEKDIETALEFLASPFVRSIEELDSGNSSGTAYAHQRYFPSASNAVARQQLDLVARFVDPPVEQADGDAG